MAYLALYRRYRPKTFDEVVGQDYVVRILKNQILSGRIGHAYLFTGIRGTGKTSLAKIFARAVNCVHTADGNPCLDCECCRDIEKSGVMDIIEIDGASNRGVDEIREIREKVKFPPTLGRYKVYIIDEVHMLTKEAFNALLKTLEEPPEHVIFILATTEVNKVPATILSRCQRFDIKPIPREMISRQLRSICDDLDVNIDDEALDFVAYRGDSSMRDALSILDQVLDIGDGENPITEKNVYDFFGVASEDRILDLIQAVTRGDHGEAIALFSDIKADGKNPALVFDQLIEMLRRGIIARVTGDRAAEILGLPASETGKYAAAIGDADISEIHAMVDYLIEERPKLRNGGLAAVVVEMGLLTLCDFKTRGSAQKAAKHREALKPTPARTSQASTTEPSPSTQKPAIRKPENDSERPPWESPKSPPPASAARAPETTRQPIRDQNKEVIAEVAQETVVQSPNAEKKAALPGTIDLKKAGEALRRPGGGISMLVVTEINNGFLRQTGENELTLSFYKENGGEASVNILKEENRLKRLEERLQKGFGSQLRLKIALIEKSYEEMTPVEKVRSIIDDSTVEIVEVEATE